MLRKFSSEVTLIILGEEVMSCRGEPGRTGYSMLSSLGLVVMVGRELMEFELSFLCADVMLASESALSLRRGGWGVSGSMGCTGLTGLRRAEF